MQLASGIVNLLVRGTGRSGLPQARTERLARTLGADLVPLSRVATFCHDSGRSSHVPDKSQWCRDRWVRLPLQIGTLPAQCITADADRSDTGSASSGTIRLSTNLIGALSGRFHGWLGQDWRKGPGPFTACLPLPPELPPRLRHRRDLVHRPPIEEPAVDHDVPHALRVADVLERVRVEDDEVGELAGLDRAEVLVEAEVLGAVQRGGADDLERGETALCKRPHLPVRGEAIALAVCADQDAGPAVEEILRRAGDLDVEIVVRGGLLGAAATRLEDAGRHEALEPLVLPDVRFLVPVVLGVQPAVVDDESRRVAGLGGGDQRQDRKSVV